MLLWHLIFLTSIDLNVFFLFLYMLTITEGVPNMYLCFRIERKS